MTSTSSERNVVGITSRTHSMQPIKWKQTVHSATSQKFYDNPQLEHIYHQLLSDVTEDALAIQEEFDRYFPSETVWRCEKYSSERLNSPLPEVTNIFTNSGSLGQNTTVKSKEHQHQHESTNMRSMLPPSQSTAHDISRLSSSSSQSPLNDLLSADISSRDTTNFAAFTQPCDVELCKTEPLSPTTSTVSNSEIDAPSTPNHEAPIRPQTGLEKEQRTRRTNKRKKGKLWEFLLELLMSDNTNPSIIRWEDRSRGVFRIIDCKQVACLWGKKKSNPSMTYEKLSRALRYYYELDIIMKIEGHKLLYQFGDLSEA